jgi:hypothetical protein
LVLFLGLVALAMIVVESLEAPQPTGSAAEDGRDILVLRLGREPEAGVVEPVLPAPGEPPPAPPPRAPAVEDPADYYVVQPGDTLSKIAQEQLGSALLAGELARINRLTDPDKLEVGQVLYLR